eukprot:3636250-Pyramimonas_sp.AAC.2
MVAKNSAMLEWLLAITCLKMLTYWRGLALQKKLRDLTKAANSCRGGSTPGRGRAATAMAAAQAAQQMETQGGYLSSLQTGGGGNPEMSMLPVSQEGTSLGDGNPDNKVG